MNAIGRYDGSLQMFVEERRQPDLARLRFLRWLVEHGEFDREPAGSPRGEFAAAAGFEALGRRPLDRRAERAGTGPEAGKT